MMLQLPRWPEQQRLERLLPISAIGAKISERPFRRRRRGHMHVEIGTAIQRTCQRTTVEILDDSERGASEKGKVDVKARNYPRRDVVDLLCIQTRQRDR